jgi:hypothetical protein
VVWEEGSLDTTHDATLAGVRPAMIGLAAPARPRFGFVVLVGARPPSASSPIVVAAWCGIDYFEKYDV